MPHLTRFLPTARAAFLALAAAVTGGFGAPAQGDPYDPPAGYYSSATGTGATLKMALYQITKATFAYQSYGDSRYLLDDLWADPNNSSNLLNIYSGTSVSGVWDNGVTWNREHIATENSLGIKVTNAYKGYGSDLFELAPAVPADNSSRSNLGYGYTGSVSTPSKGTYGSVAGTDGKTYWYAGDQWKGDAARSLFYMATRYGFNQGATGIDSGNLYNVTLANGAPTTTGQMGDLNSLLHWAYEDGVDTFERRKNELVYNGPQGNRNPYIDHPEYIWAVFGTQTNTSELSVATPSTSGASSKAVNLGRVIAGTAFSTSSVTLTKTGSTPTTFNVTAGGSGTSTLAGTGEVFDYGAASRGMVVGLTTASIAGSITGTVTIDNTDLTSAGTGQGSADGDDVVNLTGTALDHSNASFSKSIDINHLTLSFGSLTQGSGVVTQSFSIANLTATAGYTAGLDLDSVSGTGSTSTLFTDISLFTDLTAGAFMNFLAKLDTSTIGSFSSEYQLAVSDENIPGATTGTSLVLDLSGTVIPVPEPGSAALVLSGLLLLRRRPARRLQVQG